MRIAIVAPLVTAIREPQLGGSQSLVADIAAGLVGRGHDVSVFASTGSSIHGVRVIDTGVDPSALQATLYRADGSGGSSDATSHAFAQAYDRVGAESWDVVHNHAFDAPAIEHAPADAPVVHTLHLPPQPEIADALRSTEATVATPSEWMRSAWSEVARIDVVLRNGVPTDQIPFDPDGGDHVLFAGRISPEKGVREAIDAADSAGVRMKVVGDPYDVRYAENTRVDAPHVEFVGAVERRELWRLMGRSRAVLCLAQWDEPFGLVAGEALACGTPVVATRRGALPEVVTDEVGALVLDADDAATALTTIGEIPRTVCREHAELHLSLDRTLDAHEQLYDALVRAEVSSS
jgi:UDP-glucose:tetrahydrobiopterin glucosyltransferase